MLKLVIVDGPNRGTSFAIHDGENHIGRQAGNAVVLASGKVSKRHCVLIVDNGQIVVKDEGSANGTFVNGVLTRQRSLAPGDKIGVGDYVLEVIQPPSRPARPPAAAGAGMGNVVRFPGAQYPAPPYPGAQVPAALPGMTAGGISGIGIGGMGAPAASAPQSPKDLKSRLIWILDHKIMPGFYGMTQRTEMRVIISGLIGALVVGSLLVVIPPLLDSSEEAILRESMKRARFIAKEIADKNTPFIANRMETKAEIGLAEYEDGVRVAVITDMENRIIAPASKLNSYLSNGAEANFALKARDRFREGVETGFARSFGSSLVVAVEPVKAMNAAAGKNVALAMAVVSIDTSLATLAMGEVGMIYSKALILTGAIALFILMIIHRLMLKPFQVLNEDMDKVLKGDMPQVTHEFKIEELNPLWDLINSALQRVPKAGSSISMQADAAPNLEEFLGPIQMLSQKQGLVVLDSGKRIVFGNSLFEEITGIRADAAVGQDMNAVARDQALVALTSDLLDRAQPGGGLVTEDFEFSGVGYKVSASAFGQASVKFYVIGMARVESS